ncbi:MAG: cyclic nucleotide-binding domain-containing protein [Elusimicrobia bacterium]|nr:cyclic nucleotide-binding domain-containing protein [Elusimicrobiota bacterium]
MESAPTPSASILSVRPVEPAEVAWLEKGMLHVGFFSNLGRAQLAKVLPYMLLVRYAAGSVICTEGEPGDAMYLIFKGAVLITKKGWKEPVARLKDGDFFGEMALLLGEPRSATVTAVGELEAFCLASVDFKRVAERSPDMTASLRQLAEERRRKLAQS